MGPLWCEDVILKPLTGILQHKREGYKIMKMPIQFLLIS